MTEIWKLTDDFENVYNVNRCKNDFNIACRVCNKKAGGVHINVSVSVLCI